MQEVKNFYSYRINGFTIGMAVVISAFDRMSNSPLTERFGRLTEGDVNGALDTIRKAASLSGSKSSILEQILKTPRVPEHQINLNQVVNNLARRLPAYEENEMRMGAGVMYQILGKNWSKLGGNNGSHPISF